MSDQIVITHHRNSSLAGQRQSLSGTRVRLGRLPDNDVVFDPQRDLLASGYHAELRLEDGRLSLRDLASSNGTFVNDRQIHAVTFLDPGDRVAFGRNGPEWSAALVTSRDRASHPSPGQVAMPRPAPSPESRGKRSVGEYTFRMVIDRVTKSSRQRTVLVSVIFLVVLGAGGMLWYTFQQETERTIEKLDRTAKLAATTREQLRTELNEKEEALQKLLDSSEVHQKKEVEKFRAEIARLKTELSKKLKTTIEAAEAAKVDWVALAEKYEKSIFLLFASTKKGDAVSGGIGTCFAISSDGLLATNSHVAKMLEDFAEGVAIQNSTGRSFKIRRHQLHPDYNGGPQSDDVALIEIDPEGERFTPLPLAGAGELKHLKPGLELGTIGFPGEFMNIYIREEDSGRFKGAVATFKTASIGRLTNYRLQEATPAETRLIQHSASTSKGTSGSPMFNSDGKVVALNNGGLESSKASQLNVAIRVDVLKELIRRTSWASGR